MYVEIIPLNNWITNKQIKEHLRKKNIPFEEDLRTFRREVADNNKKWRNGQSGFYIVHSNSKGYKSATSVEEIDHSLRDLEKRSFTMLDAVRKTRRALGSLSQGQLENNIAEVRKNRGYTGASLVRKMKEVDPAFDQPTLSRIETGKVLPRVDTVYQLAEILECEPWELVSPQYLM